MEATLDQVKRLQGCISDLTAIVALPAMWSGHDQTQILSALLSAVVRTLRLDFAYARTGDDGAPIEAVKLLDSHIHIQDARAREVGLALERYVSGSLTARLPAPNPVGEGKVSLARVRFGLENHLGELVAGSGRTDFPTEIEMLLLRVGVNQAALGLQDACYSDAQKRVAKDLERRVAIRTQELTTVNEELRQETAGHARAEAELSAVRDSLAAELSAMTRLHEFSSRLLATTELRTLMEEVLSATIALQNADFGSVQLYNMETGVLEIVAQRGFRQDFLDYFKQVTEATAACGRALEGRQRVIIEDVTLDAQFEPHRAFAAAAGFRAVQSTPLFSRSGAPLGMVSTHFTNPHRPSDHELRLTDLFARRAAELIERQRLDEDQRTLASLVENSTDFIAIASPEGDVFFLNRAGQRLVGLDGDEQVRATDVIDYFLQHDRKHFQQQILPIVVAEGRWEGEVRFRHFKTGAAIPVLQHIFFIEDPKNRRRLALATISRDLTEQKRAADALQKTKEELAHVSRVLSMGEITTSIAHEVNQPLAAISANGNACLRWLAADPSNMEEARRAAERVVRDAHRASEVIVGIRAFVNRGDTAKTYLRVDHVVGDVASLVKGEAQTHDISLHVECDADLPLVAGNRAQLQQVLLNLVLNAMEAMSSVVEWSRVLHLRASPQGTDQVLVAVEDAGVGLKPEDSDRMFDAFFTTKKAGMGMGLAISRSIVESHGGRLWATANPVHGATFQFVLPAVVG